MGRVRPALHRRPFSFVWLTPHDPPADLRARAQVSELSHRLGTAEGTNRSLEEECTRLRAANTALAREKHERDMAANEFKARLVAVDEKVGGAGEQVCREYWYEVCYGRPGGMVAVNAVSYPCRPGTCILTRP